MEYSTVKTTSSGISTNWLTKAKFLEFLGTGRGRSDFCAGHEHAGDKGHSAGDAVGGGDCVLIELEMAEELVEDLRAGAVFHGLGDEVADTVGEEGVAPEDLDVGGLVGEVRLMREDDGHQPV